MKVGQLLSMLKEAVEDNSLTLDTELFLASDFEANNIYQILQVEKINKKQALIVPEHDFRYEFDDNCTYIQTA